MSSSFATFVSNPTPPTAAATAFAPAPFKSAQTTRLAPSLAKRSAIARPMPLAAPVMTMILPLSCMNPVLGASASYKADAAFAIQAQTLPPKCSPRGNDMTAPDISLGNWFLQRSRRTPNRRALTFEGKTCTYAELQERFDRLAAALRAAGVCRGDRVAFIGHNQPAFFDVMFAAARLGAIFVPL